MKTCTKCGTLKPIEAFRTDKRGTRNVCIKCRDYHQNVAVRGKKLWIQEGKQIPTICECCGKEKQLCFDHDHQTEKHRGWICQQCNQGIALLGDNISGLKRALEYLHKSKENENLDAC